MDYIITFLEGLISFVSPCMLPMLPVYVSYFAGRADKKHSSILNAVMFVAGFTVVYMCMGLFAGTIGTFLSDYHTYTDIVCGAVIILFGLSYLDIIPIPFFKGLHREGKIKGVFSAFIFGMIFSISHTPCIGVFLGSAIMMATHEGNVLSGGLLLFSYSLGMGIPFLVSAVLIDKLSNVITAIKKHYKVINMVCGIFLIIVGIAMMTGMLHSLIHVLEHGDMH